MPNVLLADFHKHRFSAPLQGVTVRQKYGNHTLVYLDYQILGRSDFLLPQENTPVRVRWGEGPLGVSTYYGYVNHNETLSRNKDTTSRIVCLGTSKKMNSANPYNWSNTTRSAVAREIAKRYKMRSIIHQHPFVLETWSSGTRTDFQSLRALADEAGYRLWVDGATMYFLDPLRLLRSAQSFATPQFSESAVRALKITGGLGAPRDTSAARRQVIHGLDYRTNEFFTATSGSSDLPTQVVGTSANTYGEAEDASAAATSHESDYYTAKMSVNGNASVSPGTMINLEQNGLWVVSEALHELTGNDFVSHLVASRGEQGRPVITAPSTLRGVREVTGAVVRDGAQWEALLQEHVNA